MASLTGPAKKISTLTTAAARYYDVMADNDNVIVGYYGNPPLSNRFDAFVQVVNRNGSLPLVQTAPHFLTTHQILILTNKQSNIAHDNGGLCMLMQFVLLQTPTKHRPVYTHKRSIYRMVNACLATQQKIIPHQ